MSSSVHDIRTLVQSFHPLIVFDTVEEARVDALVGEVAADLGMVLMEWTLTQGLVRPPEAHPVHGTSDPQGVLQHLHAMEVNGLYHLKDLGPHLQEPGVTRALREVVDRFVHTGSTLVLSGNALDLPAAVEPLAVHVTLDLPGADELRGVLNTVLRDLGKTGRVDVSLQPDELPGLLRALRGMTLNQARQALAHAVLQDRKLDVDDVQRLAERKAQALRDDGLLDFHPVADNTFELGGFERLKAWLERAQVGFSEEARALNLSPPRGLLLVGIQGCGKSLACKYVARSWQLPLLKLEAGRLYDKFVGESEKNFQRVTKLAESLAPTVLWIDELEKAFGPSQDGGGDGGVSRRLFGAFLTWLQEKRADVFVVATANDVFSLPPELLRKGRFDEIFFVDLPDADERATILDIHLGLRKQQAAEIDRAAVVDATAGFSGAEIEQAVIAGLYRALHAKRPLDTETLLAEARETRPLSQTRREDIERLRAMADDRFVPVR